MDRQGTTCLLITSLSLMHPYRVISSHVRGRGMAVLHRSTVIE